MNIDEIELHEGDYFDCNNCGELIMVEEVKTKDDIFICPICGSIDIDHFEG